MSGFLEGSEPGSPIYVNIAMAIRHVSKSKCLEPYKMVPPDFAKLVRFELQVHYVFWFTKHDISATWIKLVYIISIAMVYDRYICIRTHYGNGL